MASKTKLEPSDISAQEATIELLAIQKLLGAKADVHASLYTICTAGLGPLALSLYPDGICRSQTCLTVYASTWRDLFAAGRERWAEHRETHAERTVRRMALEIIRLTAEIGGCSDAGLRGAGFSAEDVTAYAERACADANEIASNGPFTVVTMGAANSQAA